MIDIERVYHLAEASNWPSIQRNGLLCASDLIRRAELSSAEQTSLERTQRSDHTQLPRGASIRDQKPMPPSALRSCLIDLTPADWYALINARVFFWLDIDRLNRQRKACEPRPQVVLTIDARQLIAAHTDRIALSPINTGNARRKPAQRGHATFVPYKTWQHSAWASEAEALGTRERARSHAPVELKVRGSLPDAMQFVLDAQELRSGQSFKA